MDGPLSRTKRIVRASSTNSYPDCPKRWAAQNLRDVVEAAGWQLRRLAPSIAAAVGSGVHRGADVTLGEKAKTGEMAPVDVATDAAVETLHERIKEGAQTDDCTRDDRDAETQVRRMLASYRQDVAPKITPLLIETRLEADFTPGFALSGQADVVAQEPGRLRDLKTGRRRAHCRPQLGCYSLLARTYDHQVFELVEDWVPRTPISRPQPRPQSFVHDLASAESTGVVNLRAIARDVNTFLHGDDNLAAGDPNAFLSNPSSMLCSEKWCPAWGSSFCKEWRPK